MSDATSERTENVDRIRISARLVVLVLLAVLVLALYLFVDSFGRGDDHLVLNDLELLEAENELWVQVRDSPATPGVCNLSLIHI